jgi:F420-non-reducing hydrogenase small subunit
MTGKLKIAMYWGAGCGGCEVALLDTDMTLLELGEVADIVLCPLAVDGKYADIEAMNDQAIDVTFFNGAVRNSETEHVARLLRAKSKILIAFGACACLGGIPGLANQFPTEELLERVYETTETTLNETHVRPDPHGHTPEGPVEIPVLYNRVLPLDETVEVDYYLPGCPPTSNWIRKVIEAIIDGKLPAKGSVIGLDRTVCDECPRIRTGERSIAKLHRPHEIVPDPARCLLEQGIVCCGPGTRGGCSARCTAVNMPCRGCYGPPAGVVDQGAKILSAVSSHIAADEEDEIEKILAPLVDAIGTFCPFSVPKSLLQQSRRAS